MLTFVPMTFLTCSHKAEVNTNLVFLSLFYIFSNRVVYRDKRKIFRCCFESTKKSIFSIVKEINFCKGLAFCLFFDFNFVFSYRTYKHNIFVVNLRDRFCVWIWKNLKMDSSQSTSTQQSSGAEKTPDSGTSRTRRAKKAPNSPSLRAFDSFSETLETFFNHVLGRTE